MVANAAYGLLARLIGHRSSFRLFLTQVTSREPSWSAVLLSSWVSGVGLSGSVSPGDMDIVSAPANSPEYLKIMVVS